MTTKPVLSGRASTAPFVDSESQGLCRRIFVGLIAAVTALPLAAVESEGCPAFADFAKSSYDFAQREPSDQERAISTPRRIRTVHFTRLPIFDESNAEENYLLYRWANSFHVMTRPDTIAEQLLFKSGDLLDIRVVEESERLLRKSKYIYDANIRPVAECADEVDIEVITRDVWTITPELSFSRSGGESEFKTSLSDSNLFGNGNELSVGYRDEDNRTSYDLVFKDPNISGTRIALRTHLTNSDDGSRQAMSLSKPFFSLDSRYSWRFEADRLKQIDTQYFRHDDISEVEHKVDLLDLRYGRSRGLQAGIARRYSVGFRFEEHRYNIGPDLLPPSPFPADRELSYPYFHYESIEDDYQTGFDLDQIHRTEDLHLGRHVVATFGYSPVDEERLISSGAIRDTIIYDGKSLLTHGLDWHGYWNLDRQTSEQVTLSYAVRYFRRVTEHRSFFAHLSSTYSRNLSAEQQLLLGGESGLRGYPNQYQVGDRRYLLTLEHRTYTDYHLLNIIRVGWSVFLDAGRAWYGGSDNGENGGNLTNLGIGLRLSPSKTNVGQVIHLDLAFPLQRDDDVDSVEFVVSIKDSF